MITAGFLRQKWPKRNEYLVEESEELNIGQLAGQIPPYNVQNNIPWNPPSHPHLKLIPRRGGAFIKWWLQCPTCGGRFGSLYVLPDGDLLDWRCRKCHGLIYASQRYGGRHPLRKVLTPLKRAKRRNDIVAQERKMARNQEKQRKLAEKQEPILDKEDLRVLREMGELIEAGLDSIEVQINSKDL